MREEKAAKFFSAHDFKLLILELLNASTLRDGVKLQKLEGKIIDAYQSTTMTHFQYETLIHTQQILLEDWRVNYK